MNERDLLLAYGEWLDSQSLIVDEDASSDKRSLDQLAVDFLIERNPDVAVEPRSTCAQCGQLYSARACGPTHALLWQAHLVDIEEQDAQRQEAEMLETNVDWGGPARIRD